MEEISIKIENQNMLKDQSWFEKLARIEKSLEEVSEHGIGEITIKIRDGSWILITEVATKDPNIGQIQDALDIAIEDGYGTLGVECGEVVYIRRARREKI